MATAEEWGADEEAGSEGSEVVDVEILTEAGAAAGTGAGIKAVNEAGEDVDAGADKEHMYVVDFPCVITHTTMYCSIDTLL